jgi:predicted lipoprotein with Yx(FWY)xxD motif
VEVSTNAAYAFEREMACVSVCIRGCACIFCCVCFSLSALKKANMLINQYYYLESHVVLQEMVFGRELYCYRGEKMTGRKIGSGIQNYCGCIVLVCRARVQWWCVHVCVCVCVCVCVWSQSISV